MDVPVPRERPARTDPAGRDDETVCGREDADPQPARLADRAQVGQHPGSRRATGAAGGTPRWSGADAAVEAVARVALAERAGLEREAGVVGRRSAADEARLAAEAGAPAGARAEQVVARPRCRSAAATVG